VKNLIDNQYPTYAHLPIKSVKLQGHDNRSFRIGKNLLIKLPIEKKYENAVFKENTWLPLIKPFISFRIPNLIHIGKPTLQYPLHFAIYE
jgi:aminoglycoside phosphotransferase (APT) family kinase protein